LIQDVSKEKKNKGASDQKRKTDIGDMKEKTTDE